MPSDVARDEEAEIQGLYQLSLADFVAARNALAKRFRQAGDREAANRVKALIKPSVSAWAVNQVYWSHREAFDRLIDSGRAVREAQAEGPSALRDASRRRREAVAESLRLAEGALRAGGHAAGPGILKRVETSLESLAAYGPAQPDPPAGRLVGDVAPPGFEALAGLTPAARPTQRSDRRTKKKEAAAVSKSDRRREQLELQLRQARKELESLGERVKTAAAARDRARAAAERELKALIAAQRRWTETAGKLEEADSGAREAAGRWQRVSEQLAASKKAIEDLREKLRQTGKSE